MKKNLLDAVKLKLRITKELQMSIDAVFVKEGKQGSFHSFLRRTTLQALETHLQGYSAWEKRGKTWTLPSGETVEIDVDGFPERFASFEDSDHKKSETETIEIDYPRFAYEGALRCAALQNSVIAVSMTKNPEMTKNWKLYETVGDWFKDIVFIPSFLQKSNDVERDERKKLLDSFEEELEREQKKLQKAEAKKIK